MKCGGLARVSRKSRGREFAGVAALAAALVCLCISGCKKPRTSRLTPAQVHQITQELAKAASGAAPSGSVIKTRRPKGQSGGATAEELYVELRGGANEDEVEQKLEGVATRRGLTVDSKIATARGLRMALRSQGVETHRIEIRKMAISPAESADAKAGQARLAILLDDLGSDRGAAEAIFALRVPITISVLPFHVHSQEIAAEARQRGCEVMLHLPMQSLGRETAEQQELKPGYSTGEIRSTVEKMLDAIPEADGVNNHQGSQATADAALMQELMRVLKDEGVFYVDSRTTAATVAYDSAKREGVPTAYRNVPFLDDVQNKGAVKRQLQIALQGAKSKGEAIAIGHPHPATLEALREMIPEARKDGIQLVLVSELVR